MRNNIHPNQISLFDSAQDRNIFLERERERERERRLFHGKYDSIISVENLLTSWNEFLRGKRTRRDVIEFEIHLMDNIIELYKQLKNKTYSHGSYSAFKINDPKPRDIHKASVTDRLLHHAVYRILYPYFEAKFIFDSYSCRKNKGTHKALNRFRKFARKVSKNNTKTVWILKCDIKKFFANINQQVLLNILGKYLEDKDVLWLSRQVIDSFHPGLPLGNLTSQLLVNIYMNEFDQYCKRRLKIKYYIRYADDFVILSRNRFYLRKLIPEISKYLKRKLMLSLHGNKVYIKTLESGIDFLGWVHFPDHRILRTTTKKRMFKRLKQNHSVETLNAYFGLLRHGNTYKLIIKIQ